MNKRSRSNAKRKFRMHLGKASTWIVLIILAVSLGCAFEFRRQNQALKAQLAEQDAKSKKAASFTAEFAKLKTELENSRDRIQADQRELTKLRAQIKSLADSEKQLGKLRGQRDALEREKMTSNRQADEDTPEWSGAQLRLRFAQVLAQAIRNYLGENENEIPSDLSAAIESMDTGQFDSLLEEQIPNESARATLNEDLFEIIVTGRVDAIRTKNSEPIFVARERQPHSLSNGRWTRVALFHDGHAELLVADSLDLLTKKESKRKSTFNQP